MADTGTYLYAITRAGDGPGPEVLEGLKGVAGAPVRALEGSGLAAYVSTVPLEEFGEGPLRRSLEDLDWVGETARAHHRVVEAVAGAARSAAPVRLVTVYSGDEQVRDLLDRRGDEFASVLSRVAGRQEWGVKAYAHRPAQPSAAPAAPGGRGAAGAARPGTEYLRRRKASLRDRDDAWREAAERAEMIHGTLAEMAVASTRHRPQDPRLSGRDDWMLLNGAYLVENDRRAEFAAALDAFRGPEIDIELTGPWAPYSFTALETAGGGMDDTYDPEGPGPTEGHDAPDPHDAPNPRTRDRSPGRRGGAEGSHDR
ncbi:GvpL/GvpF family gas vesicle protein [Sphaerisporangium rhizosphaerae]|uniref:GvpL/GvpF family gas vesicle protein n=1 Tax=Sphaerisporangium rhizosphaerae TaxID=2269375 RepID=A0ABW2PJ86_9ACTN